MKKRTRMHRVKSPNALSTEIFLNSEADVSCRRNETTVKNKSNNTIQEF